MAILSQLDGRVHNQGQDWQQRLMSCFVDN